MSNFFLVQLVADGKGGFKEDPLPNEGPFDTGLDATTRAKHLMSRLGLKVQPRRISQAATDWRERLASALPAGARPLPKEWNLPPIADHFAHLAAVSNDMIGYFRSEAEAIIGKVTPIKPGRYIEQFYPGTSDGDRRRLVAAVDPCGEVHFAMTREEIRRVYIEGPRSCMSYPVGHSDWRTTVGKDIHPTEIYAAGDLGVAYLLNEQRRISTRVVVWPEKKLYGRIYGDLERMKIKLREDGYKQTSHFDGAKLLKIPSPQKSSRETYYIMPYWDNIASAHEEGDFFVTDNGNNKSGIDNKLKRIGSGGTGGCGYITKYCPSSGGWEHYHADTWKPVMPSGDEWSPYALADRAVKIGDEYWDRNALKRVIVSLSTSRTELWTPARAEAEAWVAHNRAIYANTIPFVADPTSGAKYLERDWAARNPTPAVETADTPAEAVKRTQKRAAPRRKSVETVTVEIGEAA